MMWLLLVVTTSRKSWTIGLNIISDPRVGRDQLTSSEPDQDTAPVNSFTLVMPAAIDSVNLNPPEPEQDPGPGKELPWSTRNKQFLVKIIKIMG